MVQEVGSGEKGQVGVDMEPGTEARILGQHSTSTASQRNATTRMAEAAVSYTLFVVPDRIVLLKLDAAASRRLSRSV